ncbi:MAG: hypothetical protein OMOMHJEC_02694 [Xanthomonadales bacterium]|nr:hypothetical protein [Xanthomonadales bacterium]
MTENKGADESREIEGDVVKFAISMFLAAVAAYALYFGWYQGLPVGGTGAWGEFGDFVGGVINPVVGLVTVLLVARTLWATRLEASQTREEMKAQTCHLERQIEHYEKKERLDELRQRLAGVLSEWNIALELPLGHLMKYTEDGGAYLDNFGNRATRTVFYSLDYVAHYNQDTGAAAKSQVLDHWNGRFGNFVQLLDELALYCSDYEKLANGKEVTDFYRRRIQVPLRLFRAIGMLGKDEHANLNIGMNQRVFARSNVRVA